MSDEVTCYLCYEKGKYIEAKPCDDDAWLGGRGSYLPEPWCHDYNQDGDTIHFCKNEHRSIWRRAVYLSWQAVSLIREFAKTMRPPPPQDHR